MYYLVTSYSLGYETQTYIVGSWQVSPSQSSNGVSKVSIGQRVEKAIGKV